MYTTFGIRVRVDTEAAGLLGGESRGAAVASEVALLKDLNQLVLTMALNRARVADAGGREVGRGVRRGRVACQAGENVLAQGAEWLGAILDALESRAEG